MTLNEIAARWLGEDVYIEDGEVYIGRIIRWFRPLTDRNDLVRVEEKLLEMGFVIELSKFISKHFFTVFDSEYVIRDGCFAIKEGSYPADYPTALLELVKTLYEGKER
jgi:hypothetical protein